MNSRSASLLAVVCCLIAALRSVAGSWWEGFFIGTALTMLATYAGLTIREHRRS